MRTVYRHDRAHRYLLLLKLVFGSYLALFGNLGFAAEPIEDKLKAAYLVNIASFVKWAAPPAEILLCISESSKLRSQLLELDQYAVTSGSSVRVIVEPESIEQCHMAFWDLASSEQFLRKLGHAQSYTVVISDAKLGGPRPAIQLFVRNLKLRFSIDRRIVKASDYRLSSKLWRLSRQID